jgi:hypothetical protein
MHRSNELLTLNIKSPTKSTFKSTLETSLFTPRSVPVLDTFEGALGMLRRILWFYLHFSCWGYAKDL